MTRQTYPASFRPHRRRQPTIERPRLLRTLDRGLGQWDTTGFDRSLTLVTGPAGFGKTTLVADWLARLDAPSPGPAVAWLDLESRHNDPVEFGAALLAALPGAGMESDGRLPLGAAIQRVLKLIDGLTGPLIVVLDDYHLITHPEIHAALNDIITHLTPSIHLVLLSRADPPLPLARLRTRRALTEVRARDLRFTAEEAAAFLQTIMGLDLSADEVALLEQRTEGWVAGLQLAAHSLQNEADRQQFLDAFAGDDRYVADYLLEEVLLRQPPDIQQFLLRTSILRRLAPELCDAVTGRDDSQAILAALEQANLFVVPLDSRRQAYRYHQLFSDLLAVRLLQSDEDERELHRRAARWLAGDGQVRRAVDHALAAGDTGYAADLITATAQDRFLTNELTTLVGWVQRLPDEVVAARPRLCLAMAWAAIATGLPDLAEAYAGMAEEALGLTTAALCDPAAIDPDVAAALIEAAAVTSRLRVAHLDAPGALALCRCALGRIATLPETLDEPVADHVSPPDEWPPYFNRPEAIKPVLLFNQGLAYSLDNRVAEASRALSAAAELGQVEGNAHLVALALGHLAHVERIQGQLALAEATCKRGRQLVDRLTGSLTPLAGVLIAHQGSVSYERLDLDAAVELWRQATALALPWGNWEALVPAHIGLARVSRVRGEWLNAFDALDTLLELAADQTDLCEPIVAAYRAWFLAETGEMHAALQWVAGAQPRTDWAYLGDLENQCRTYVLLHNGDYETVEQLAREEAHSAAAGGRWGRWIDYQVALALALQGLGRTDNAEQALEAALERAAEEGIIRPFIEAGPKVVPLLQAAGGSVRAASMARRVLQALPWTEPASRGLIDLGPDGGLLEPLTERELEVLHHIADGRSNREIAGVLFLTEGTVKNHAHSIYSKLDANGRTHAVARARSLGLLTEAF